MRKTQLVTLTLLTAIAAAACDENVKQCVDENDVVQEDTNCANPSDGGVVTTVDDAGVVHTSSTVHIYRWYYGSYTRALPNGTRVSGGSYTPSGGVEYSTPSISRGGFGGTGEGFGAHGGTGAGE